MRLTTILLFVYIVIYSVFLSSCTLRRYEVNFNYYVGNNGYSEKFTEKDIESIKKAIGDLNEQTINIPPGSGNLTVYIQADVPKHIETDANADLSIPLVGK